MSNLQDILSWDNNKSYLFSISNGEGFSEKSLTYIQVTTQGSCKGAIKERLQLLVGN